MVNTKVTKAVLADDAVGLAQLDITNDPSDGQALTAVAVSDGYNLTWANNTVAGISSSADATAITITSDENVGIGTTPDSTRKLHIKDSSGNAFRAVTIEADNANADAGLEFIGGGNNVFNIQQPHDSAGLFFYDRTNSAERLRITNSGKVGVNTATVPHGSVGHAMFAMDGANNDTDGPHVQYTTASDNYPIFQQLNWGHDNISFNFDMYYDGSWRSSDAGSNYQIYKYSDQLQFWVDDGITAGGTIAQEKIGFFDTSGRWQIPKQPHVQGSVTTSNNSNSTAKDFTAGTYSRGTLSVNVVSNQARFTAPVDGIYLILFKTIMGVDTSRRDTTISVNGAVVSQALNDVANGYHYRQMAEVLALSANDYVTLGAENWYDNTSTGYTVWRTASMTLLG